MHFNQILKILAAWRDRGGPTDMRTKVAFCDLIFADNIGTAIAHLNLEVVEGSAVEEARAIHGDLGTLRLRVEASK